MVKITYWAFERNVLHYDVAESNSNIENSIIEGPLITEMQQLFKSNYAQTFRLYNTMDIDLAYIDNRVHIGPIDEGFEFITKYKTELNNNYIFYTNQNGLEYAGNYYPSTGQTYIKDIDTNYKFSTVVNQGHGVGSYKLGEYEIMLQRRCLADDHKGVNEVLNTSWTAMNDKYSDGLPEQIFLMQFRYGYSGHNEALNDGLIFQLQNMLELNECPLSQNITINLNSILNNNILNIRNSIKRFK